MKTILVYCNISGRRRQPLTRSVTFFWRNTNAKNIISEQASNCSGAITEPISAKVCSTSTCQFDSCYPDIADCIKAVQIMPSESIFNRKNVQMIVNSVSLQAKLWDGTIFGDPYKYYSILVGKNLPKTILLLKH